MHHSIRLRLCFAAFLVAGGLLGSDLALAAEDCEDTPEGRICKNRQAISAGVEVDAATQKRLGLVTINGGCSGTLLNRFWVLTARHCVTQGPATRSPVTFPGSARTVDDGASNPLLSPSAVQVTADWAPGMVGTADSLYDFQANRNTFAMNVDATSPTIRDIVLIYLGTADLGPVDSQRIYLTTRANGNGSISLSGRLRETDRVTQYGRGFSTFASGVFGTPSARPSSGLGTFRSAPFTPSSISDSSYDLAMTTPANQVGHGGDSGGPTVVTVGGVGVGIAGVQSTCTVLRTPTYPTGYVTNAPTPAGASNPGWLWATGISACQYVATVPFLDEILLETKKAPPAPDRSQEISDRDPTGKGIEQCNAAYDRNRIRCGPTGFSCNAEVEQIMRMCMGLAQATAAEVAADRDPTGKSVEQCNAAYNRNRNRCGPTGFGCNAEIEQIMRMCMGQAQAASAEAAAEVAADRDPTGKSVEQCNAAYNRNLNRCVPIGPSCNAEIEQIMRTCMGQAQAAP